MTPPARVYHSSYLLRRYSEAGIEGIRLVSISVDGAHDTPDQGQLLKRSQHVLEEKHRPPAPTS